MQSLVKSKITLMMKLNSNLEKFNDIYLTAKAVYLNKIAADEAAERLFHKYNIPYRSFKGYYLQAYRKMREGEPMHGGQIPQGLRECYLKQIYEEYGKEGLLIALKSYKTTIEYYKGRNENPKGDECLYDKYIKVATK